MAIELACHAGIGPAVEGTALVADDNFSARYDLDRIRGVFSRPQHKLYGQSYCGVILVLNTAGYWAPLLALIEQVIDQGFADASLFDLLTVVDTPTEAMESLRAALS